MMYLLLLFVSRIPVCTCMLLRIGLQSSDKYVHYYYGDGIAQEFESGAWGGLVHITTIGYVNKLAISVALF